MLVKKCFEAIEPLTPKLLVVRYPARDFAQGSRVQSVESLATFLATAHEPDVKQDRQMLGDDVPAGRAGRSPCSANTERGAFPRVSPWPEGSNRKQASSRASAGSPFGRSE